MITEKLSFWKFEIGNLAAILNFIVLKSKTNEIYFCYIWQYIGKGIENI
jgi:hypothetical protein